MIIRPGRLMRQGAGLRRIRLLQPGAKSGLLTFARAQTTGVEASHYASDGTTLVFDAADTPRFNGTAQRLLIEGQRTRSNLLAANETLSTQSVTVTATPYTLTFWGTGLVALSGTYTGSLAGTGVGNRVTLTFTPTAGSLTLTVTGTVSRAQLEAGSFASTYIRKQDVAATRGADLASATLASLGIGANGACTVLGTFMIPQAAPSGVDQALLQIDAGSDTSRIVLANQSGGLLVRARAPSTTLVANAGSFTAGSAFVSGMVIRGDGTGALCITGGSVQQTSGIPTSGLSTLRVGNNLAGTSPLSGSVAYLDILPYPGSDAQLQALVAAMPLT